MIAVRAVVQQPVDSGIVFSATVGQSALFLLPQTLTFFVTSTLATKMDRWPGSRTNIILGTLFSFVGQLLMWMFHHDPINVIAASAITGIGIGLIYSHLATLIVRTVPDSETAAANGMNTNIRNIGGSVGTQVAATIIATSGAAVGYPNILALDSAVAGAAVAVAFGMLGIRKVVVEVSGDTG
jgi:dipeptide/tripeptide permease